METITQDQINSTFAQREKARAKEAKRQTLPPCIGAKCTNYNTPGCRDSKNKPLKRCDALF